MNRITEILLTDLRHTLADLGKDAGLIDPSLYDTPQVLRLAPSGNIRPSLDWLREQQQLDGGWGTQLTPRTRDVPTLAAILALHKHSTRAQDRAAIEPLGAVLDSQNADESWLGEQSTFEETAHGVLALLMLDRHGKLPVAGQQALQRATRWMLQHYRPGTEETAALRVGKELYRPRRVARAYELCAFLGCVLQGYSI